MYECAFTRPRQSIQKSRGTARAIIEPLEDRLLLAVADWTVLYYLDGDNNIDPDAMNYLNELEQVGSNAQVNIIVEVDRAADSSWSDTRRGRIIQDADPNTVTSPLLSVGEKDMANPTTLLDFLRWGTTNYPAQHYAAILWDHGGGSLMGMFEDDSSTGADGSYDIMSISDLGQAFAAVNTHFEVIDLDACVMGMTEVAYQLRSYASVMVASEESEYSPGQDYVTMMRTLEANPASTTATSFANTIVTSYGTYTQTLGIPYPVTLSAIDLTGMGPVGLAGALDNFVTTVMRDATNTDLQLLNSYYRQSRSFDLEDYRDLGSILGGVASDLNMSSTIVTAAQAALTAYNSVILSKYPSDATDATGLSIYWQKSGVVPDVTYLRSGMSFLANTQWDEFLLFWFQGIQPGRIQGGVWNDLDLNGSWDPGESGLSGWTVYLDANNNGHYDPAMRSIAASTDVPTMIPDSIASVYSTLPISSMAGSILDVNLTLSIQYSLDYILEATLISPQGTRVPLFSNLSYWGSNFANTTFDDQASVPIGQGVPPFVGTYRPQGYLSDLNGEDPNGVWQLEITSDYPWDTGFLTGWSLSILHGDPSTITDNSGMYTFSNVDPGTYAVGEVVQGQFYQSYPPQPLYTVTVGPGQAVTHIDFGNALTVGRPDLAADSDSGTYDDDKLTNLDNSSRH